jgi:hypothetical protein
MSGTFGLTHILSLNKAQLDKFGVTETCLNKTQCKIHMNKYLLERRMSSSGMLRRVALVRTDVSDKRLASMNSMARIGELETALAVTINRSTQRRCAIYLIYVMQNDRK